MSCTEKMEKLAVESVETSAAGNKLTPVMPVEPSAAALLIKLKPEEKFQKITGFGGAFTQSSAYLLNQLSAKNRTEIIEKYFGESGARYSLTRSHMNSCDFSTHNYSYAEVPGDTELKNFSVARDLEDVIPMIKEAMAVSKDGFKIIASPWTAPPWMKDNNSWKGGKLKPEYYATWALFFVKYLQAYKAEGIDIWGFTVENEPLGNDSNWESMHFTPQETAEFVKTHLGPTLQKAGYQVPILGYDQNRGEELKEWADALLKDPEAGKYFAGMAVHWYNSTVDWFPESLQYAHELAPEKYLINTEACVDAEVPHWKEDEWYWKKEATDWGWDWAPKHLKKDHPKYVPVYRYARDIIGCLNNWVDGWIDWNMVLDTQGGPNWAKNWCHAPVIVDPKKDEVYYTPLYYTMSHFSRFIRPGATRIGFDNPDKALMVTAAQNPDGSLAVVALNMEKTAKTLTIELNGKRTTLQISAQALQTIMIAAEN